MNNHVMLLNTYTNVPLADWYIIPAVSVYLLDKTVILC